MFYKTNNGFVTDCKNCDKQVKGIPEKGLFGRIYIIAKCPDCGCDFHHSMNIEHYEKLKAGK